MAQLSKFQMPVAFKKIYIGGQKDVKSYVKSNRVGQTLWETHPGNKFKKKKYVWLVNSF